MITLISCFIIAISLVVIITLMKKEKFGKDVISLLVLNILLLIKILKNGYL